MKQIVVNLWGGPGCGKSTAAAYIFSCLKMQGYSVELVGEFAKDKTWEENRQAINNQAYIFGEQYHRLYRLTGKVDVIVSDSPLPLSLIYNTNPALTDSFEGMIWEVFGSFENWDYLLAHREGQSGIGRWEDEKERITKQHEIEDLMIGNEIAYWKEGEEFFLLDGIVADIKERLKKR